MKIAVFQMVQEIVKKKDEYRMKNFDLFVRADLSGLVEGRELPQKRYPFPMAEKPEFSYRLIVDHAGVNYWKVREQVRGAMMYFGMSSKEALAILLNTTLGQQCGW